jgi:hypothetical protein
MTNKKMEGITLNIPKEKAEEFFHDALCNGSQIRSYGIGLDYKKADYQKAVADLKKIKGKRPFDNEGQICCEEVWMQILRNGGKLTLKDEENSYGNRSITMKHVHDRMKLVPFRHMNDMINESGDGDTADVILQTIFYKEVIFG